MGLFGKKEEKQKAMAAAPMSEADGFGAVIVCAMASDGQMQDEEKMVVASTLSRMKLYNGWQQAHFKGMIEKMVAKIKVEGPEQMLTQAVNSLSSPLRDTAFAVACDIVMADGVITEEEKGYLGWLYQNLGVDEDTARAIFAVLAIKNRG
jgi:tellurite resistance protein